MSATEPKNIKLALPSRLGVKKGKTTPKINPVDSKAKKQHPTSKKGTKSDSLFMHENLPNTSWYFNKIDPMTTPFHAMIREPLVLVETM
jgi:hypothetical protein